VSYRSFTTMLVWNVFFVYLLKCLFVIVVIYVYLVHPEGIACGADLSFTRDVFFFQREISEMRGPTGVKFCTMVSTRPNFIMPVQNFGGTPQKNFRSEKHAKFCPISNDFKVRRRISPKRMKIFKIGFLFRLPRFLLEVWWSLVQWPWGSRCEIVPT